MVDERYIRRMVSIARKVVRNEGRNVVHEYATDRDGSLWINQTFGNQRIEISYVSVITPSGYFDHEVNINHDGDEVFFYDFSDDEPLITDDRNWERELFSLERRLL